MTFSSLGLLCALAVSADAGTSGVAQHSGGKPVRLPFRWEIPNVLNTVDVPGTTVVDGIPVRLRVVTVRGKAADIADQVVESFARQGLFVPAGAEFSEGLREWQITGYDPNSHTSYSVLFRPHGRDLFSLVLGQADLGAARKDSPQAGDIAPLFPSATDVVRTHTEGLDSLGYFVEATEREVKDFYQQTLAARKYVEAEPGVFRKDRVQLRVSTLVHSSRRYVLVTRSAAPVDLQLSE